MSTTSASAIVAGAPLQVDDMGFPISNYDLLRARRGDEQMEFDVLVVKRTTGPGGVKYVPGDIIKDCPRSHTLQLISGESRAHGMIGFTDEDVKTAKQLHKDREALRKKMKAEDFRRMNPHRDMKIPEQVEADG